MYFEKRILKQNHLETEYINTVRLLYKVTVRKGINPSLDRIRIALNYFGNPQLYFPAILVGGTNGKGSVVSIVDSILRYGGYKTGLYTSPHLHSVRERIRVCGEKISKEEFISRVIEVLKLIYIKGKIPELTFFEIMTLICFWYFKDVKVDLGILEVGMGGRWDATSLSNKIITAITNVELDHTHILGNTKEAIAQEKFALFTPTSINIGGKFDKNIREIFFEKTKDSLFPSLIMGRDFFCKKTHKGYILFQDRNFDLQLKEFGLRGEYQLENLSVALEIISCLKEFYHYHICNGALEEGVKNVFWPGRMEFVNYDGKFFILDCAHNPAGISALVSSLKELGIYNTITIFGVMKDKDFKTMIEPIDEISKSIIFTKPKIDRALVIEKGMIRSSIASKAIFTKDTFQALKKVEDFLEEGLTPIVITGSIFTVAELRRYLLALEDEEIYI